MVEDFGPDEKAEWVTVENKAPPHGCTSYLDWQLIQVNSASGGALSLGLRSVYFGVMGDNYDVFLRLIQERELQHPHGVCLCLMKCT